MGSTINATTFGSAIARFNAGMSLNGTISNPGRYGPKPFRHDGSVDDDTAARERPQKLPDAKTTLAWSCGTPLTSYPHRRASFTAVSPPSTPEFIGRIRSYPK